MSTLQNRISFNYSHRTTSNAAAIRLAAGQRMGLFQSGELFEWLACNSALTALVKAGRMSCWRAYRIANNL
jgi:hypothetical protein